VRPPTVAVQRLSKQVPAATNTHARIEELSEGSFSLQSAKAITSSQNFLFSLQILQMRMVIVRNTLVCCVTPVEHHLSILVPMFVTLCVGNLREKTVVCVCVCLFDFFTGV
jgi:hypothetical protein